ncbi:GAF domain-containing protein [Neobacillus pocheonensis]|uniref:GAF domain-containing protein n=1 Tax=Neobacillus pocheonensis TaxID=363869 RepID=A0ABT0WI68_9BACI|nr:GAF domain-containing protein [Neobacillus pocheonensis]
MEQIYQKTLEELTKLLQCEVGSIVIIDGKQAKILSTFENGHSKLIDSIVGKEEVEALEKLEAGSTIFYPNWNHFRPMGSLEQRFFAEGVRSSIFIPILHQAEMIAGIKLASKKPYHFAKRQMHVINKIIPLLSFGLSFIDSESKFTTVIQTAKMPSF